MKTDKSRSLFYIVAAMCLVVVTFVFAYKELYYDRRYIQVTKNEDTNVVVRVFDTATNRMEIYQHYYEESSNKWRYIHFIQEPEE